MRRLLGLLLPAYLAIASPWLDGSVHSPNNTLFTWEDAGSDLPIGTYIATGVSGIIKLAEYLADQTEVEIMHLLISDSTIEDVDTRHGYRAMSLLDDEGDVSSACDASPDSENPRTAALRGRVYPSLQQLTVRRSESPEWSQSLGPLDHGHALPRRYTLSHRFFRLQRLAVAGWVFEHFPHLTHLRITGLAGAYRLPAEMAPNTYRSAGWMARLALPGLPPAPSTLTVIVQPGFNPMFYGGWCGTPGIEYDELFRALQIHPPQRQIQRSIRRDASGDPPAIEPPRGTAYSRQVSPRSRLPRIRGRAGDITTPARDRGIRDGVRGGEGAWGVPRPASEQERCLFPTALWYSSKDSEELETTRVDSMDGLIDFPLESTDHSLSAMAAESEGNAGSFMPTMATEYIGCASGLLRKSGSYFLVDIGPVGPALAM
ncbi:hypothetical protein B0H14DRAFT_3143667, partial [Mycena olivaceomarginata]